MSIAVFYTNYSDLPYQVSTTAGGGGFNTVNIIVDQTSMGFEWEGIWQVTDAFRLHSTPRLHRRRRATTRTRPRSRR